MAKRIRIHAPRKTAQLKIRITPALLKALMLFAAEKERAASDVVRDAIRTAVGV